MSLETELAPRLTGRVVLVGVGNPLRGDDAAGCLAARRVRERDGVRVIVAEEIPEAYLGPIAAATPNAVVLLDAVDFGAAPGSFAILGRTDVRVYDPTTHRLPLSVLMELVELETGADVLLVGIQPSRTGYGQPPSDEVAAAAELVGDTLNRVFSTGHPAGEG
jgi:hydrogenase 3 maturation protease